MIHYTLDEIKTPTTMTGVVSEQPIGIYRIGVVWVEPYVGVHRVECARCGLAAQGERHERPWDVQRVMDQHVCDPARKKV